MAFVATQRISTVREWKRLHAALRVAGRLQARRNLTPQERANLYISQMPTAVITGCRGEQRAPSESAGR
jgi:hypothetical protein